MFRMKKTNEYPFSNTHSYLGGLLKIPLLIFITNYFIIGVLDSRSRGCGIMPHWMHCVVSLSKTLDSLRSTGSTQESTSGHERKIVDWDVKNENQSRR